MADLGFRSTVVATGSLWCDVAVKIYETGTNVGNNTSSVFYTVTGQQRTDYGFTGSNRNNAGTIVVNINGSDVCSFSIGLKNSADRQSRTGTVSVGHNADGTKTCSISLKLERGGGNFSGDTWTYNSNSASGSLTLSTIPRASQPSLSTGSASIGNTITINTNRATSSFKHSLWWSCGNSGWKSIATGVGASQSWTIPNDVANYITSSTSGTVTILCRTFNGSTQISSDKSTSLTVIVPDSFAPTMGTPTAERVDNGVPSSWGVYVKGHSKVKISMNGVTGSYGSWITGYQISGANLWSTSSSATSDVINSSGSKTYTCKITDSRGRTCTKTVSITVADYSRPSINVSANRCTSDGTISSSGTYLKCTVNWNIASVSEKNSVASRSASCNGVSNSSFSSGTAFVLGANVAVNHTYTLFAIVQDGLGYSASASVTIPTDARIMNVKANKKGIAFGKFAENDGFEVEMDATFDKELRGTKGVLGNRVRFSGDLFDKSIGKPKWVRIGAWENSNNSDCCKITVLSGNGYNGRASQNTEIEIFIKNGWQDSPSTSYVFGGSYIVTHNYTNAVKVKLLAQSHNTCDVWVYMPWDYWDYTVFFEGVGAWVSHGNYQDFEPTNGTAQDVALHGNVADSILNENNNRCYFRPNTANKKDTWLLVLKDHEIQHRDVSTLPFVLISGGTMTGLLKGSRYKEPFVEGNNVIRLARIASSKNYIEFACDNGAWGVDIWASDASLKKNIKNTEVRYALEKIAQLHHVGFDWKENDGHVPLGYVADDVEKVLPCLVFHVTQYDENNKPNGFIRQIDHTTLIPLITMGMQELIEEKDLLWQFDDESADCIIRLRQEVDDLKDEVKELKAMVSSLTEQLQKGE